MDLVEKCDDGLAFAAKVAPYNNWAWVGPENVCSKPAVKAMDEELASQTMSAAFLDHDESCGRLTPLGKTAVTLSCCLHDRTSLPIEGHLERT